MTKLKKKIFYLLVFILTLCTLSFIIVFNIQKYYEQKNQIENNLTGNKKEESNPPAKPEEDIENIKFMDTVMYTVLLDENDNIKDVINHSNNNISNEEVKKIANKYLKNNKSDKYIGNLYFEKYSYAYSKGTDLIIIDNTKIKNSLLLSLEISLLIFIILEVIIIFISKIIADRVVKPVKESFDKQKTFVADASHELKTPLSVIIASSEALSDNPNETKWLNNIKSEADRMNLLITDLLELSKTENISPKILTMHDLSKTVELSLLTFEGTAYEKNIKLNYDIEKHINMKMDEESIKQLIEILLDNAIKHSKTGSTINITLKKNKYIELTVQNKGDNIPKGEEEKIFERFYRVDKSRNRKENRYGLGLAIAKNIVTMHGGNISAFSKNNLTTFKVRFK